MKTILKDKVLMTTLIDAVVSLVTYFGGKYGGAASQDIITFIGVWQVVTTALVVHYISEANNEAKLTVAKFKAALVNSPENIEQAFTTAMKK